MNKSLGVILFIVVLLGSFGQMAADIYLPSLPAIAVGLNTTSNFAQLSMSLFMLGFCLSQMFYGPLSDAIGRKKIIIFGLSLSAVGTILCLLAPHISQLITGRFLQGFGAGVSVALTSAVLRDVVEGRKLAQYLSYLAFASIFFIASAPFLGGVIQHAFDWRSVFMFLLIYLLVILMLVILFLPETNKNPHMDHLRPKVLRRDFQQLFSSPVFLGNSLCIALAYGGILAWLTAGPIVMQDGLGFSPFSFGVLGVYFGGCFAVGTLFNARFVMVYGMYRIKLLGIGIMLIGAVVMLLAALFWFNQWVILIPMAIFLLGCSLLFSNAFAMALSPFPNIAGKAGALLGTIQILGGFLTSSVITLVSDASQFPMAIILVACAAIALLLNVKLVRPGMQGL